VAYVEQLSGGVVDRDDLRGGDLPAEPQPADPAPTALPPAEPPPAVPLPADPALVELPPTESSPAELPPAALPPADPRGDSQAAARETLRVQVARLERELSGLVARAFPHVGSTDELLPPCVPRMLGLTELERTRDRLVNRIADTRRQLQERAELERRSRELLQRARLEPRRYKFLRIAVADLGEGTCGAWEVRPRLGPIGMIAGWWQVKLSSGCP
jgi:hypothetical protein